MKNNCIALFVVCCLFFNIALGSESTRNLRLLQYCPHEDRFHHYSVDHYQTLLSSELLFIFIGTLPVSYLFFQLLFIYDQVRIYVAIYFHETTKKDQFQC